LDRRNVAGKQRNYVGHKFWSRGYFVSTVGADEKTVRAYIQNQEADDKRIDQLNLFER
jgi:putative transposase